MRRFLTLLFILMAAPATAQITVPHTLTDGETIDAARLNTNFSTIAGDACNRTGCTMTGTLTANNIAAAANDTYDIGTTGMRFQDAFFSGTITAGTSTFTTNTVVGGTLGVTGNTTFTGTATANSTLDVNSTFTVGSGNVQPFTAGGKIQAISSTYFDSLDGTNLTGVAKLASTNTFTARNDLKTYTETKSTSNPSGGAITYDLSTGTHFETALTGNATVTISNVPNPSNGVVAFTVKFTADGTLRDFTWPAAVVWAGGVEPAFTSTNNKRDVFTFVSWDAGTTWFGFVGGQNF